MGQGVELPICTVPTCAYKTTCISTCSTIEKHLLSLLHYLQVVAEANKPEWSGGYRGLQTYLQRLLHPTWDTRFVSPAKANPNSLMPNLNEETLKVSARHYQVLCSRNAVLQPFAAVLLACSILDLHAQNHMPGSFCLAIAYRHTEEVACQLTNTRPIV